MNTTSLSHESTVASRLSYIVGFLCLIVTLTVFVLTAWHVGSPYYQVWQLILAHIVGGRALNAGRGIGLGFSPHFILFQSCMQDFIIMFFAYPLFVKGYEHLTRWPFVGSSLKNVHESALEHRKRIAPYGVIGLTLFVIFPFWSTGPLVGVLVGYLLGMRAWVTFSTVIAGDIVAVAAWIWAYDRLFAYNRDLAMGLLLVVLVAVMAAIFCCRGLRAMTGTKK